MDPAPLAMGVVALVRRRRGQPRATTKDPWSSIDGWQPPTGEGDHGERELHGEEERATMSRCVARLGADGIPCQGDRPGH